MHTLKFYMIHAHTNFIYGTFIRFMYDGYIHSQVLLLLEKARAAYGETAFAPQDPTVGPCLGPYGVPRGWAFSYERGTPDICI